MERLELSQVSLPEPKSGASTNSATSAFILYCYHIKNYQNWKVLLSNSEINLIPLLFEFNKISYINLSVACEL